MGCVGLMVMALLIDCYNVLHAALPPMLAGMDEAGLCVRLGRTPWAGSGVTVVADGRPKPGRPTVSPVGGVTLTFSALERRGGSADDVIIRRVRAASAPRRLTVVSSDRMIREAARRRRAASWSSEEFINRLCRHLSSPGGGATDPAVDRPYVEGMPPELVERWVRWMGAEGM